MIAVVKEKFRGVKKLEPVLLRGSSRRTLERFDSEERQFLEQILAEPVQFVDSPMFHSRKSASELEASFEPGRDELPTAQAKLIPIDLFEESDKTITAFKPLTTDQEARLFLKLNYCRYMIYKLLRKRGRRPLTVRLARDLLKWKKREFQVRAQLTQANIPLVLAMAKRARPSSVDFSDLISEGNMALLRSVDKFDCGRGFKFSTYACRAILKSFSRLALRTTRYRGRFPVEYDPDLEKSDLLKVRRENERASCVDRLRDVLGNNDADLDDIERKVLRTRFAINDDDAQTTPMTLEQVGKEIGVTKERVRQIQNRALGKLREVLEDSVLSG